MSVRDRSPRRSIACAAVVLVCACGPSRAPEERSTATRVVVHGTRGANASRRWGEFVLGGASDPTIPFFGDAGHTVAVAADAGVASGEAAWLVAHIDDGPDGLHPMDTASVRALSARGPDGIRGVVPVLRSGDPSRAPFARRVLERVAIRACGRLGLVRAMLVGGWL
jgi:hypothetical protein